MDGIDALPDEDLTKSQYRDELARPKLQHETGNQLAGNTENRGDDPRVRSLVSKKTYRISSDDYTERKYRPQVRN